MGRFCGPWIQGGACAPPTYFLNYFFVELLLRDPEPLIEAPPCEPSSD
jgi:hypothetical protein